MDVVNISWFNYDSKTKTSNHDKFSAKLEETIKQLPALNILNNQLLLQQTINQANSFMKEKEIFIVFGTGGANLGSRALVNINNIGKNKIFFYDNIDPNSFNNFLKQFDLDKVGFIIISKSGSTPETLSQFSCLIEIFKIKNKLDVLYNNCLILTENKPSPLRNIGSQNNCMILNHEKNIGGRYSVFTNVGIFPAIIAGLNVKQFYLGATSMLKKIIKGDCVDHKILAHFLRFQPSIKVTNSVLMTYSDSLFYFGKWYLQLWAERIGTANKGITTIHSVGTTDQHSQLQLYLDGPRDKFFTFITTNNKDIGVRMNYEVLQNNGLEYLAGRKMGDLMQAEQKATLETFIKNGFILREINLPIIDEFFMGQLMCLSMIETIATCIYYEVNPFNQPAVEQGKILTKQYLTRLKR